MQAPSTVRVDTRKLDSLMNLIGELVIAQSRIMQLTQSLDIDNGLKEAVSSMDRTSRQIQEEVMNIRMMPVGPIFNQFHRYVRDLNLELNKEVKLVLKGETTEIDKNMLEQLPFETYYKKFYGPWNRKDKRRENCKRKTRIWNYNYVGGSSRRACRN